MFLPKIDALHRMHYRAHHSAHETSDDAEDRSQNDDGGDRSQSPFHHQDDDGKKWHLKINDNDLVRLI